jgi:hypothetical protein
MRHTEMDETAAPPIQENLFSRRIKNYFIFMSPVLFLIFLKPYLPFSESGAIFIDINNNIFLFIFSFSVLMISPNVTIMFDPARADISKTFLKMLACIFVLPVLRYFVDLGGNNNGNIQDLIFIIPICAILISENISDVAKNFRTVVEPLPIFIIPPALLFILLYEIFEEENFYTYNILILSIITVLVSVFLIILTTYNSRNASLIGRIVWICIGLMFFIKHLFHIRYASKEPFNIELLYTRDSFFSYLLCIFPFYIALGQMKKPKPTFKIIRVLFFSLTIIVSLLLLLMTLIAQSFLEISSEPLSDTVLPLLCGLAAIRLLLNEITGAPKVDEGWVIIAASIMIVL